MTLQIVQLTGEYKALWNTFVFEHAYGSVFQTYDIGEVYQIAERREPIRLVAIDSTRNEICAGLIGYISVEKTGILKPISSRAIIHGGPLFLDNEMGLKSIEALIEKYDSLASPQSVFTEIWNLSDYSRINNILGEMGYQYIDHLNFLIDLRQPINAIWNNLSQARRKNIRRSREKGILIDELRESDAIDIFYRLLQETYGDVGIPLASKTLLTAAFETLVPRGYARFFLAKREGEYVGARAILTYKDSVYDWYAGSRRDARSSYPDEALVWHILEWAVENNYRVFDFGGAGHPDEEYGPREFKRRFGGSLVNFGRYRKVYAPIKMKLARMGLRVYQKMPVSMRVE